MDKIFTRRMECHQAELRELYLQLYRDEKSLADFCTMLESHYKDRRQALKDLDLRRESNPNWYKDQNILGMQIYPQCFGNTLKGVESHLDYLQETGVNYLHLMPLLESPAGRSDGGYAVANFRKVDPSLGTMEDLAELTERCHAIGISVCLDFVMNHTSEDHEWAQRARKGEKKYQDCYFFYDNWDYPNEFEKTVPQVFPSTAPGSFTWCEEAKKVVMTTFYPYQWDLNYANPIVFREMSANMLFLCNQGIDVIRLDATPYIWKTLGTSCRNLHEVHTLVRMMRLACDIVCPGTLLLGEVVMEPSKVIPYFGCVQKPECHMLYNVTTMASTWHTVATHDVRLLRHQMETVFHLPKQYTFLNYLRCHDDIGWGLDYAFLLQFGIQEAEHKRFLNDWFRGAYNSDARGELYNDNPKLRDARLCGTTASLCGIEAASYEQNTAKLERSLRLDEMLHAFLLVQSGVPVLYSGDEVAQENDYSYHSDPLKRGDSRYLHRGNMDWISVEKRDDLTTKEGKIFNAIGQLVGLRRKNRVFHADADTWTLDTYNDHVLGIGRYYQGQKLLAFFNFSELTQTAWVNEAEVYADLLTGKERPARGVSLPGYGFAWLVTDFSENRP